MMTVRRGKLYQTADGIVKMFFFKSHRAKTDGIGFYLHLWKLVFDE